MTPAALHRTEFNYAGRAHPCCVGGENKISIFWGFILKMNTFSLGLPLKAETYSGLYIYWVVSVIPGDNFLSKIGINALILHFNCALAGSTACWQACVEGLVHNLSCDPPQITDHKTCIFVVSWSKGQQLFRWRFIGVWTVMGLWLQ